MIDVAVRKLPEMLEPADEIAHLLPRNIFWDFVGKAGKLLNKVLVRKWEITYLKDALVLDTQIADYSRQSPFGLTS